MGEERLLGALALCRKAGKLAIGFDAALKALKKGACLAVTAKDISPNTLKKFRSACGEARVLALESTQEEIERVVGRRFALAAVCDEGLARLVESAASQAQQGEGQERH
ncbi:MAG: ribosomal L7Ae/L30e/S12e/Gadd45 family protein [Oscillospiraceae bacterium]|nr:ribosomal L7Ae/L30e/S12e/Gadd45 family protein [Oscillospiraceae bacterium]